MTKKRQKISIITVCFNEPRENIALTFKNICSQTYDNTEWIVIDGHSRSDTIDAINQYSSKIDKFISEPDNGIYDAMNKGISCASGDFIVFMNVGDRFYNHRTIEHIADFIQANPSGDCFYGDVAMTDSDGNEWALPQIRKVSRNALRDSMVCHQAIFSRKSLYETVGKFDLRYRIIADKDWVLRTVNAGAKWLFTDMFVSYYQTGGISADVSKREGEMAHYIARNYSTSENFRCFFFRKYRNLRQRIQRTLKCKYKGLPIHISA